MASRLYCDMDGVLVDFHRGAGSFFGIDIQAHNTAFNRMWENPEWQAKVKREWPTFWMDLDPMSHAFELWKRIAPYHPAILTAIPKWWPSASTGKRIWVRRHFPKFGYHPHETFHAVDRSEKQHYAKQANGTPNILIDDHKKNIAEWKSAGGIGVLYTNTRNGLADVDRVLADLTGDPS